MPGKIFLHLLIFCGIWSQGITGTLVDEEIHGSSDSLSRQKRVISHVPSENIGVNISTAPHVVIIKQNRNIECVANVLSWYAAITAAACVLLQPELYQVFSRTARLNYGSAHNVTGISRFFGHPANRGEDGIALVTVRPPFRISAYCLPINLHTGPLLPSTYGRVSGWGFYVHQGEVLASNLTTILRTIEVPIISHQECIQRYLPHIQISNKDICTYHPQRHCGHTDRGAGLVVGHRLAGVFLHSGIVEGQIDPRYPDVFALVQDLEYHNWITTKLNSINALYHRMQH